MCVTGELSINDFRRLKELLVQIKRVDLKNRVDEFEKKIAATRRIPLCSTVKQSMLSNSFYMCHDIIIVWLEFDKDFLTQLSRQVGTNWRMVVRRLGISDMEIDEIEHDYHKLREQSYQAFRLWVDKKGGYDKANPDEIKIALLDFQLRRIAEEFFDDV